MLIESVLDTRPEIFSGLIISLIICYAFYNRYGHGLNHIPGPFLASLSEWWRLFVAWGWQPHLTHIRLHEKYGDVVRIGPKTVIVRDPEGVKKIYALNAGYIKVATDFIP